MRESGKCEFAPTVRGCIMIAKTLKIEKISPADRAFETICKDILASETSRVGSKTNQARVKGVIKGLVKKELSAKGGAVFEESVEEEAEKETVAAGASE